MGFLMKKNGLKKGLKGLVATRIDFGRYTAKEPAGSFLRRCESTPAAPEGERLYVTLSLRIA